jgi:hypothetical protein
MLSCWVSLSVGGDCQVKSLARQLKCHLLQKHEEKRVSEDWQQQTEGTSCLHNAPTLHAKLHSMLKRTTA